MTSETANKKENSVVSPIGWAEMGLVPDAVIRAAIRRLTRQRLKDISALDVEASSDSLNKFVASMNQSEIAPVPELANEQHYEVPAEFFSEVLGPHKKYSSCYWSEGVTTLEQAEAESLRISCERAGIKDGMQVLDLGCGWGSLSLWIARHYPGCNVVSVSNSAPQRRYIESVVQAEGLSNIQVITCDMNEFTPPGTYDRIVSVEMFEHMRNYRQLYSNINSWLNDGGKFFMHIFCHRNTPYEFVDRGASDWMSRHFFSGGIMPSADLPLRFQEHLKLEQQWKWSGRHYEKTSNAWLQNTDEQEARVKEIFAPVYGEANVQKWLMRWRIFFMACAELFALNDGQEWFVSHYLFSKGAH